MKISFSIKYHGDNSSGKHKFASRLAREIKYFHRDVLLKERTEEVDAHITFDGKMKPNCKNIYRVDGIWVNSEQDYNGMNKPIIDCLKAADGVIFQSEFCQEAINKVFNIYPKNSTIIYNGANPQEFNIGDKRYRPKKLSFIAMCKWRPHKRLKYIVDGFLNSNCSKDSILHVFGEPDYRVKNNNVIYYGFSQEMNNILPWCISSIHLSYLDWCPNAIIESLTCGVPVISVDSGGSKYLVKGRGILIKDREWDYSPIKLYQDDRISLDINEVSKAYDDMFKNYKSYRKFDASRFYISQTAVDYINFIKKTIG